MNLKKIENPFGGLTYYKESTRSTMADASETIDEKNIDGSLFITDNQTNGIGRVSGRKWESSPYQNLTFTLVLDRDTIGKGFGCTPLKAGLALSKVIKELTGADAKVKWPNDVLVNGKKISGILCHSSKGYILVGVGINVNQLVFDKDIEDNTTSLSKISNNGYNLEMVLTKFLNTFYETLRSSTWLSELNSSLYRQGEEVRFSVGNPDNNNIVEGVLQGLDDQGKVIIISESGDSSSYLSGEFI
ncbi:biotin--[acetyl-CoA-carboxylase] ligase [Thiospirochaeta perfilievii]|uniref:Biotin--[acetyl-CoA-carboxylase] ligase n=1 Tax=Thiospirochaeta perfilievii TaxID=252967 RepID=A0A5C1Q845_9SPIO|nr:biotin--[acetyl-CoA-carboxylase] ligase [Thiospirochaeta perfilievii]QEN04253.1 biotin--[acetyl-CoA-carboxylase] ligase [Thiospirochaeta perfilievii]